MYDTAIHNGRIVSGSDVLPPSTYIGIKNGIISTISAEPLDAKNVIDAQGAYVTPGGIDAHVHLEEPGMPYCDTFLVGTKAAVAGGTTTVIAFALQNKNDTETSTTIVRDIAEYKATAEGSCFCDYGFHLIVRKPYLLLLAQLPAVKAAGVSSIKVFTTYDALKMNDQQLLTILLENKRLGITQMVHAENHDIIQLFNDKLAQKQLLDPYYHAVLRPPTAEDEASYRVILLSSIVDIPIMIVHMLAPAALEHVHNAQQRLVPVMAETCPQYVFLKSALLRGCGHSHGHDGHEEPTKGKPGEPAHGEAAFEGEGAFEGAKFVCSPPLRDTDADLEGVWRAILNGTVTIVSSDHAPSDYHAADGKQMGIVNGRPDYKQIPNGLPGVETRMPLMFCYGVEDGRISVQRFVELTATNPAKVYGLGDRKGSIQVGYDADIVVWHPEGELDFKISKDSLYSQRDYSPFEGMRLTNWPKWTLLRGQAAFSRADGVLGTQDDGRFLHRGENTLVRGRPLNPLLA